MFKILDGRSQFYQWDLDRKVIVEDASINEVHFCNRTDDCSLICEVYELDGLRVADVPNILLQENWRINVYAYDTNYTKHCDVFDVVKRSKPADYVYTETEIKNYDELLERLEQIEENGISDEAVAAAVEKYMDENDIKVDLTGYATEEYVQEQIEGIEIPETDLTGYATEKYVDEAVAAIEIPDNSIALASGKTITDADTMAQIKTIFTNGLNPAVYVDGVPVATYMTVGTTYLYLFAFVKTTDTSAMEVKQYQITVSSNKATISSAKTAKIKGYATEQYVKDAIAAIDIPEAGGDVDLTNYYTKSEVDAAIQQIELTPGPEGKPGKDGQDGKDGEDYVLTDEDKQEIAGMVEVSGGSVEEVYVGTDAPTDENVKLWVNPDEESSFAKKSDLANFQTASQVQTAINNALAGIKTAEEGTY